MRALRHITGYEPITSTDEDTLRRKMLRGYATTLAMMMMKTEYVIAKRRYASVLPEDVNVVINIVWPCWLSHCLVMNTWR